MKNVLEAALFISGRWLSLNELARIVGDSPLEEVKRVLNELIEEYKRKDSALIIVEDNGKYKMDVRGEYLDRVKSLAPHMDMSSAVLKVLSYIAYKQPVKQSELVDRFGNRVYEYVRELLSRGFIKAEPCGRTRILTTTEKLLSYLGEEDAKKIRKIIETKVPKIALEDTNVNKNDAIS